MTCPVCSSPMPPNTALRTCTFLCALVAAGRLTLDQIQPWLAINRPPLPKDAAA